MKKIIRATIIITQLVAAILYVALYNVILKYFGGHQKEYGNSILYLIIISIILQTISTSLKNKYPKEVDDANKVMQQRKKYYGLIALAIFAIAILIVLNIAFNS